MIYLKKDNEIQTAFIPKNGSYEGKLSYKEGYKEGYVDGMEEGKNNPYTTKGVFVENGLQKHIAWGFNVEKNYPVSYMDGDNILEISFYPLREGGLITSDRAYFDFVLEGGKLKARVDNFEVSVDCELYKWHTLKMQGNGFWLDKVYHSYPISTSYQGTMHIGRSWRDGRYYGGYISYIYATEDEGVEMYYYYDKNDGQIKRLNKRNGIWKHENQMWGTFPPIEDTPPMESVMIDVPTEGGNCPELTELNVSENGRYEGAYNIVNVDVPQEGGSCNLQDKWVEYNYPDELTDNIYVDVYPDEGYDGMGRVVANVRGLMQYKYDEGYEVGKAEGGGCNLGSLNSDTNSLTHNDNLLWGYVNELSPELDGWHYISIDYRPLRKEIAEQTKNKIVNELQALTITQNGYYEPAKVKCMDIDSDDIFHLGEFNSRNIYDITFTPKSSNYDSKIFGGWVDGKYMGLSIIDGDIVARWGKYKAQAPYIEGEITHIVIKPFSDDSAFIINDDLHSWWVDDESATDDFNTNMYLGDTDGRTANFDFYKMTIYEDYEGWVNDYNKIAVILPYADNQIDVQGVLKENIGNGAYCAMKEEKLSLGFSEVVVNVPQEGGSCNLEETRWAHPTPDEIDTNGYLVYHPTDGYDGMQRIALQMDNYNAIKYNEGYEAGKAEGGSCNLGELNVNWESGWNENNFYAENDSLDGYNSVHIDATTALKEKYDEGYNNAIANGANLTPSAVEKKFDTLAFRTENLYDGDIIRDRTKLRGLFGQSVENFITYSQNMNSIVICEQGEFTNPSVMTIENGALDWNKIEYFHSFTIKTFGEDMTRDTGSNLLQLHINNGGAIFGGSINVHFKKGCFATSNRLRRIIFHAPYYINVEENAFEGVSSSGEVVVVGEDMSENRAKYDTLMSQLGDGWSLNFVNQYNK